MAVFGTLCCSLQRRYSPDLFLGNAVDPGIGDEHNRHGDVEADKRGGDGVGSVKAEVTVVISGQVAGPVELCVAGGFSFMPVKLNWDEGDKYREGPCHADHQARHFWGHLSFITERAGDGPVTIDTDDTQVQDGGSGTHDVKRNPDVAECSERPKSHNLHGRLPWHYQNSYQKVRDSQRDDE